MSLSMQIQAKKCFLSGYKNKKPIGKESVERPLASPHSLYQLTIFTLLKLVLMGYVNRLIVMHFDPTMS